MGMIQRRHGAGFAFEALAKFGLGGFQRDDAVKPRVTRFVDVAHAALANGRKDFVGTEECAHCE